jgi:hypothetical protein
MTRPPTHAGSDRFRVVGIGASAGGLDALKELLGAMPADSGMAFVIVQHLDPAHESRMAEILTKSTAMRVLPAEDGMPVEPNTVYTNPPGRTLSIRRGRLALGSSTKGAHVETAIDHFLTLWPKSRGRAPSASSCRAAADWTAREGSGDPRRRRDVHGAGTGHRAVPRDAPGGHRHRSGGLRAETFAHAGGAGGFRAASAGIGGRSRRANRRGPAADMI